MKIKRKKWMNEGITRERIFVNRRMMMVMMMMSVGEGEVSVAGSEWPAGVDRLAAEEEG